ncbi:MAG: hypothetical protein Q8K67_03335 [Geothrix sp.]|nr:hypothetical protein [Geothrix sp.]
MHRAGGRGESRHGRKGPRALLAFAAVFLPAEASDPPPPLFHESEAAFLRQVDEGAFDPHLELHLVQYSADPRWTLDWAASRYARSGFFAEYGSTSSSHLFVNAQVALNLFPAGNLQFRYDRRLYQDRRFDLRDERFDFLWYPRASWALVASGWPLPQKEQGTFGAGVRMGPPGGASGLTLLLMEDRPFWNEKTDGSVTFTKAPRRVLLDGHAGSGAWRFHGTVDFGLPYQADDRGVPIRSVRGYQRFGDVGGEYQPGSWAAGARATWAGLLRDQTQDGAPAYKLDRSYGRILTYGRARFGNLMGYGLLGWAWQRDTFASPAIQNGSYRMGTKLFGMEAGWWPRDGLELRFGYLGNGIRMERRASPRDGAELPWPDRDESGYADKVHGRAIWSFSPRMSIELLLSQTVGGARFGGGSLKARFVL